MGKKRNKSYYCRMRGGFNEHCSGKTYNKEGICMNCREQMANLLGKIKLAKELGIEPYEFGELERYP